LIMNSEIRLGPLWFLIRNDPKRGQGPRTDFGRAVPVPNLSHCNKQLGQAQPVPGGQEDWDRLCLSQWDRQAACTKPVPLGQGKVKRDLFLSNGTSHIPTMEAFPCPGTSSILTMEIVPVPLVPTCPTKWVYKTVDVSFPNTHLLKCFLFV
jgi:hypothetical protein